jgi:hypothetical protein
MIVDIGGFFHGKHTAGDGPLPVDISGTQAPEQA